MNFVKGNVNLQLAYAEPDDADSIAGIYNDATLRSYANLDVSAKSVDEVRSWLINHREPYIMIKAVVDDLVAGYISLDPYKHRKAIVSIYVDHNYRGMGIGRALMEYIIEYSRKQIDIYMLIAYIVSANKTSIHLHESFGFINSGIVEKDTAKFDKPVDLCLYRLLTET